MSDFDIWTVGPNQVSVTVDAVLSPDKARHLANWLRVAADTAEREAQGTEYADCGCMPPEHTPPCLRAESELPCYCARQDCPRCRLA